jgi:hypothetical protein
LVCGKVVPEPELLASRISVITNWLAAPTFFHVTRLFSHITLEDGYVSGGDRGDYFQ